MLISDVVNSFPRFIEVSDSIFYCSVRALGVTGFRKIICIFILRLQLLAELGQQAFELLAQAHYGIVDAFVLHN